MTFIKKELKMGAILYVLPVPQAHTVASGVLVNVGSREERNPKESGLAHAVEHMLLQGTKRFPDKKSLSEFIEEVGGIKNASTSKESTLFFNQVPFEEFERSVVMLSEQVQHSLLLPKNIASEVQVIVQEINRAFDLPAKMVYEKAWEYIFKGHPLGHMVLGTKESVLGFKLEDLVSFMERYYHPSNYTFLVVGNIDPDNVEHLINQYFVGQKKETKNERFSESLNPPKVREYIEHKPINQAHISLAAPIHSANESEKFCLKSFAMMASSGSSSPLFDEVRTKRGLCYSINTFFYAGVQEGLFMVDMATGPDKYQEAIDATFAVLEKTKNNQERLEKSKRRKLGGLALANENPLDVLLESAKDITFYGRPMEYDEIKAITERVTIEEIQKVVDKYLRRDQFYSILILPEKAQ